MTHQPLVSIIIPVFNGSKYLRFAIDSALRQTYQRIEVLVINDGSTDDSRTRRIAESYGNRIRYIEKPNGGVGTALNEGLNQMRGEYFSWLSHDDVYYPTKVGRLLAFLAGRERSTIAYSHFDVIDHNGKLLGSVAHPAGPKGMFRPTLIYSPNLHGCAMLIHRCHFDRYGLFNPRLRYTQDYDMWFRLGKYVQVECLPERLIQSRTHNEAGSARHDTRREEYWLYRRAIDDLTATELRFAGSAAATYLRLAVGLTASPTRCTAALFAYEKYKAAVRNRLLYLPMELRYHACAIYRSTHRNALSARLFGTDPGDV